MALLLVDPQCFDVKHINPKMVPGGLGGQHVPLKISTINMSIEIIPIDSSTMLASDLVEYWKIHPDQLELLWHFLNFDDPKLPSLRMIDWYLSHDKSIVDRYLEEKEKHLPDNIKRIASMICGRRIKPWQCPKYFSVFCCVTEFMLRHKEHSKTVKTSNAQLQCFKWIFEQKVLEAMDHNKIMIEMNAQMIHQ